MLERITGAVWATMIMTSPIGADLLSGWIEDGTAARIADWKRHEGAARQAMAKRLLRASAIRRIRRARTSGCHCRRGGRPKGSSRRRAPAASRSTRRRVCGRHQQPKAVRLCLGTPRTRAASSRR